MITTTFKTAGDVLSFVKDNSISFIDLRFCDLLGAQHHFTMPSQFLTEDFFKRGTIFDGSSIEGFSAIYSSDLGLIPDPTTAFVDIFRSEPTLAIVCHIIDPQTQKPYDRDPRQVAVRAQEYLTSTKIADFAFFAPEAEFYIFDSARYFIQANKIFSHVDAAEGPWGSGAKEHGRNLGHKIPLKGGYFPLPPVDKTASIRDAICVALTQSGLVVERAHHEVGAAGQTEINFKFNTLLSAADDLLKFKYIVKNTATEWNKTVTFMPKPIHMDNGSGLHTHQSLWKDGATLFYAKDTYANLSDIARWYIGGLLHHGPSLAGFCNPSSNSYKRLVKGYEAPVNLAYSLSNRSAAIRIPQTGACEGAKRIEFRTPDSTSNPYLAFSAQLMAGIDGIKNKIEPGEPLDKDIYSLSPAELANVPSVPSTLKEALDALKQDHQYLLEGGVFSKDMIESWIALKTEKEITSISAIPHPYEFALSYSC